MNKRSKRSRHCSLCESEIGPKEQGHVMKGKYLYYKNYALDIGEPTRRRHYVLCPACTTATAQLWGELHGRAKREANTEEEGPGEEEVPREQ
jgi:hypothetical protein